MTEQKRDFFTNYIQKEQEIKSAITAIDIFLPTLMAATDGRQLEDIHNEFKNLLEKSFDFCQSIEADKTSFANVDSLEPLKDKIKELLKIYYRNKIRWVISSEDGISENDPYGFLKRMYVELYKKGWGLSVLDLGLTDKERNLLRRQADKGFFRGNINYLRAKGYLSQRLANPPAVEGFESLPDFLMFLADNQRESVFSAQELGLTGEEMEYLLSQAEKVMNSLN